MKEIQLQLIDGLKGGMKTEENSKTKSTLHIILPDLSYTKLSITNPIFLESILRLLNLEVNTVLTLANNVQLDNKYYFNLRATIMDI